METTPTSTTSHSESAALPDLAASANGASAVSRAATSAHAVIDETAQKVQPVVDRVAALAHQATDKAGSAGNLTAGWLGEQGKQLAATEKKLVSDTREYVAANPLKSIGIALAAGFLISRIVR